MKSARKQNILEMSENLRTVREDLLSENIHLCPERARLITEFFRKHDDPDEPMAVRKAKALRYVLSSKSVKIYPGELIVGNIGSYRKSCILQPELASAWLSQELLWIDRRKTNPFDCSWKDRLALATRVFPYWILRCMPTRMFPGVRKALSYIKHALDPTFYLINEAGGIGHFLPDYARMVSLGTTGFREYIRNLESSGSGPSDKASALREAALISLEALEILSERFASEAEALRERESDPKRKSELDEIARICRKVPREPAETFHEALQSIWFTHMGIMLESLNSAVSFGRMDQYLLPVFKADLETGNLTEEKAIELLLLFSAKATEHVFLLTEKISEFHGGFLVVQALISGGLDEEGEDATNELSRLFLKVMRLHRMRDPNFQVRISEKTDSGFLREAIEVAKTGYGAPAFFNDRAIIPALVAHGFSLEDARNYGIVGCVEPSIPGKSFLSTDAGLFNLPICLELALNCGRRAGSRFRVGVATPPPESFKCMDDVIDAFRRQVDFMVDNMIEDFHMVERGNMKYHPTPLSSTLVSGCLESGLDLTEGGAVYNQSGIQGVGVADVADSLAAIDEVVFRKKRLSMHVIVRALLRDFEGCEDVRSILEGAPKYGNDESLADTYASLVVRIFHDSLARHRSLRKGRYVPGFFSVTCHVAFGKVTGALPSGRKAGKPFASAIGPACGADKRGPTALLNSVSSISPELMPNGNALNMRFDPAHLEGEKGTDILEALIRGFFSKGGMEVQFNIIDPQVLIDAKKNPGKHPDLIVRVAGYCARFDDLPESTKEEIIQRTVLKAGEHE